MRTRKLTFALTLLLAAIPIALAIVPGVSAQAATCPDNHDPLSPPVTGTYPADSAACVHVDDPPSIGVIYGDPYPCGGAYHIADNLDNDLNGEHSTLVIVPPPTQVFPSGLAKIHFAGAFLNYLGNNISRDVFVRVEAIASNGNVMGSIQRRVQDYPSHVTTFGERWYLINVTMPFETGAYYTIQISEPSPIVMSNYFFGSLAIVDESQLMIEWCPIGGAPPPPTITPQPTWTNTPAATWTPGGSTATPTWTPVNSPTPTNTNTPQPFPTAPGGTITPLPSNTPITFNTAEPVPTTTPWALPTFPVVVFPTLSFPTLVPIQTVPAAIGVDVTPNPTIQAILTQMVMPTLSIPTIEIPTLAPFATPGEIEVTFDAANLTPDATTEAIDNTINELGGTVVAEVTAWATISALAFDALDVEQEVFAAEEGLETIAAFGSTMSQRITTPIAYVKMLSLYMPNLWPLIAFIFAGLAWMFFTVFTKWAIAVITDLISLMEKVISIIEKLKAALGPIIKRIIALLFGL